jgi:anti-sigma factor RsiW
MQCPESLRVQAHFDHEIDAVTAADIERHLEHCIECRMLYQNLERLRGGLRRELPAVEASAALRARITRSLDAEVAAERPRLRRPSGTDWRMPSFWAGAASGLAAATMAAAVAFVMVVPLRTTPITDELVGDHVTSLLSSRLIDVISTDQHTVKPWFSGHTDVSPVVVDFKPQGYELIGGRVAYVEHQRAAVVVYRHGQHVINVFSWAVIQRPIAGQKARNGYHLVFWRAGDLQYSAVSDTSWDELLGLVRLMQQAAVRDARS